MIRHFMRNAAVGLALGLAGIAVPGNAQGLSSSALKDFDTHAPIDIDADRIEVLDRENQAIFTGSVRAVQGRLTLEANRIRISYTRPASGDPVIERLDADGSVRLITPTERATARFGIYDVEKRILTMIGDVALDSGDASTKGNRLTINLESGISTMDGRSSTGQPGGRVSGRFAVPERK